MIHRQVSNNYKNYLFCALVRKENKFWFSYTKAIHNIHRKPYKRNKYTNNQAMQNEQDMQIDRRKFISSIGLVGAMAGLAPLDVFSEPKGVLEVAPGNMKCKP